MAGKSLSVVVPSPHTRRIPTQNALLIRDHVAMTTLWSGSDGQAGDGEGGRVAESLVLFGVAARQVGEAADALLLRLHAGSHVHVGHVHLHLVLLVVLELVGGG